MNKVAYGTELLQLATAAQVWAFIAARRGELDSTVVRELHAASAQYWYTAPQRALEIAQRARLVGELLAEPLAGAAGWGAQADALMCLEKYEAALTSYRTARARYQQAGHPTYAAYMIGEVWALSSLGRFEEARHLAAELEPVLATAADQGDPTAARKLVGLWNNQGIAYDFLGRYEDALAVYTRAETRYRAWGNELEAARMHHNQGLALINLNELHEAEQYLQRARAIFAAHADWTDLARADLNLALIYLQRAQYAEALAALRAARQTVAHLPGLEHQIAILDLHEAQTRLAAGPEDYEELETMLLQAQSRFAAQGPRAEEGEALLILGHVYRAQGKWAAARRCYQELLTLAAQAPPLRYQAHYGLGGLAYAQGDTATARQEYDRAIDQIETTRRSLLIDEFRASFLGDKLAVYQDMMLLCLETGDWRAAFAYGERARSRALLDLLAGEVALPLAGGAEEHATAQELARLQRKLARAYHRIELENQGELRALATVISTAAPEIAQLEQHLRTVAHELERRQPRLRLWTGTPPVPVADLVPCLSPETLLLAYHDVAGEVWVFPVTAAGLHPPQPVGAVAEMELLAQKWQSALERVLDLHLRAGPPYVRRNFSALLTSAQQQAQALYTLLLAPLAALLAAHSRLVVIPAGELTYVPFAALHTGTRYLLETHCISYAPSATVLHCCYQAPPPRRRNLLVLGFSGGALPHLHQELAELRALGWDVTLCAEAAATKRQLQEHGGDYDVIHLATHGCFRPYNPLLSYLTLADGDLLAREIYGLNLSAALVTLGACETGRGKRKGADWWSLARGFFAAGAAAVLETRWPIDDAVTAQLMGVFYRQLGAGARKDAALRAAQLTLLQQTETIYCHPAYWAPFCLGGAAGAVGAD